MYLSNLSWIWYYIFAINHKQIERLDVYSHPIEQSFDTVIVRDCRSITDLRMIVSFGVFVSTDVSIYPNIFIYTTCLFNSWYFIW
jgi:acetyltransferase-like isoleucine patch superfamily enzyme